MEPQNCSATQSNGSGYTAKLADSEIPSNWDWRDQNVVSAVKDQGKCGSCWAFSAIGSVESQFMVHHKDTKLDFELQLSSEQQLVDCATNFENNGCRGGLPSSAFEYAFYQGGLESEALYYYEAKDMPCRVDADELAFKVGHSVNITAGDEVELLHALYEQGPVSIAYQVIGDFKQYEGGVYTSDKCGTLPTQVNHAVLAVGFGHDEASGLDYWLVKNSWGHKWGLDGYFKIERGVNMCAIAQCNAFPESVEEIQH
jgi:cathepsin H